MAKRNLSIAGNWCFQAVSLPNRGFEVFKRFADDPNTASSQPLVQEQLLGRDVVVIGLAASAFDNAATAAEAGAKVTW